MRPDSSAAQSACRLAPPRIGGAHLNSVAPTGISSAANHEIVHAGFHRDGHAVAARLGKHGQRRGAGEMHDVYRAFDTPRASRMSSSMASTSAASGREASQVEYFCQFARVWLRAAVAASTGAATSAWTSNGKRVPRSLSSARRKSVLIHPGEAIDAGVDHEAFESRDAGLGERWSSAALPAPRHPRQPSRPRRFSAPLCAWLRGLRQ